MFMLLVPTDPMLLVPPNPDVDELPKPPPPKPFGEAMPDVVDPNPEDADVEEPKLLAPPKPPVDEAPNAEAPVENPVVAVVEPFVELPVATTGGFEPVYVDPGVTAGIVGSLASAS
jgi:hypothetical protein